jgi:hypothetical protein
VDLAIPGVSGPGWGGGGGMAGCEITSKSGDRVGIGGSFGWETTSAERGFVTPVTRT